MPNQLTQTIVTENNIKLVRNLLPENFYAQDQWTRNRLTVQGGVRFDYLKSTYPDSRVGGPGYPYAPQEIFYPARSTPGYGWKDVTPRLGRGVRPLRGRQDGGQVQPREVHGSHHGDQ